VNRSSSSTKRWRLPDLKSRDKGFGDGLSAAFELVVTPAIFGFGGFLLDRALGTVPVFTLVLSVAVLTYMVWKLWVQYMHDSEVELERWRAARAASRGTARRANG
jgi:hypothetical protein